MSITGSTVFIKGTLVTTATTADQVIATYQVSPNRRFNLADVHVNARLTTYAATATNFGQVSLESPSGVKLCTWDCFGPGGLASPLYMELPEPMPLIGETTTSRVVRLVCTPAAATSMTWSANIAGEEK